MIAAGISLILDATVKQTAGVVLLGLAASWLIGSLGARGLLFASSLALASGLFSAAWLVVKGTHTTRRSCPTTRRLLIFAKPVATADVVHDPVLGLLKFSKDVPGHERDKTIRKELESARIVPSVPVPKYIPSGIIFIPESVRRWQNPYYAPVELPFGQDQTDEQELRWIQTDFLQPRPTFMLSRPRSIIRGLAIAAVGLRDCGWHVRNALRVKHAS